MKNKLYLLTDVYPYGNAEKTFVEPEIEALTKEFDVTVISAAPSDYYDKFRDNKIKTHEDVKVMWYPGCSKALRLLCYLIFFITPQGWEEIGDILKEGGRVFLKIKKAMFMFMEGYSINRFLKKEGILTKNSEAVFYSFWLTRLALSITLDRKKYPKIKVYSRVHGYDLYNERCRDTKRQPFKKFMDRRLDGIFFICDMAKSYYLEHFATEGDSEKYMVARLGSFEPGEGSLVKPTNEKSPFMLVSCSVMIPLKRLELIIEALSLITDREVKWVHFGDGTSREEIEAYASWKLNDIPNISYEFKGYVERESICSYYGSEGVGAFITTSETEGLPVSIMEAMAYGIPVIATDVGGIKEMINQNGILISANPDAKEVKAAIETIISMPEDKYKELSEKSREIWQQDYNAKSNAQKVCNILTGLRP